MNTRQGIHPNLDPNGTILKKVRRNSDTGPKAPINPHSKVLKFKKAKGEPANQQTLFQVINKFRIEFGQEPIQLDNRLSEYVTKLINSNDTNISLENIFVVQSGHFVYDFNDESPLQLIRNWIKEQDFIEVLMAPATIGYLDIVRLDDQSRKIIFIYAYLYL
ncbi:hypothetical protein TVAG_213820 [Trichomonas vaginalis G3]|uniref:Uncharacterized protein n=1 Tax=Trichomonas vaginalis (strain ATCC PRA-98 / G3) TaxID=412133 RepID=A2EYW3_TRIV3|nr:hypothetical protein TVAGG3_0254170 [Trichomonas vaginalis G3]EAY02182.1 hypothetical protein TVAG_213820 [Trichomonas vaginalis G3]KAI5554241.1 hypothetical protein TVAGG3_0254170 [Trichomonas vaginalis G3]|eukprot:XP_001330585.1 hypothetical protein [Trichomonas vaginalis G3]